MRPSSIVYINFSQYDNTGRILDYLTETFTTVFHFSFDHLRLKRGRKTNILTIYKLGKKVKIFKLYSLRVPEILLFPSLPLVAILMVAQTIRYTYILAQDPINRPIFFTVNAYPAFIGVVLKKLRLVSRIYYWVWDYFPLDYPDWRLLLIRRVYLFFDQLALQQVDALIFPNRRQLSLRKKMSSINKPYSIIPLGASRPSSFRSQNSNIVGFMGMLKDSQGIELILNQFKIILTKNPNIILEVIGSGPMEDYLRSQAKQYGKRIRFYGFIEDQNVINRIIRRWFVGLALYKPVASNESYWGDPSKIKVYISQGVPIITTNVTEYGKKAKVHGFGMTIPYEVKHLSAAILYIHNHQHMFRKKALVFAESFYYRRLYKSMFDDFKTISTLKNQ